VPVATPNVSSLKLPFGPAPPAVLRLLQNTSVPLETELMPFADFDAAELIARATIESKVESEGASDRSDRRRRRQSA
jgi:hypothetical protein